LICPHLRTAKFLEEAGKLNRQLLQCKNCEIVFQDPLHPPGDSLYNRRYLNKYFKYDEDGSGEELSKIRASFLTGAPEGPVLDVGCGAGTFMQHCGREAVGLDISASAVQYCRQAGLTVYLCDAEYFEIQPGTFAAATFFDTLQLLAKPQQALLWIRHALVKGGFVVASLPIMPPNMGRWKHVKWGESLHYFSERALINMFTRAYYRVVRTSYDEDQVRGNLSDYPNIVSIVAEAV